MKKSLLILLPLLLLLITCRNYGSDTSSAADDNAIQETITFSGYKWEVRNDSQYQGPGRNLFSGSTKNIWVDEAGKLHLKITNDDGVWFCPEISTEQSFGYGKYIFYVEGAAIADLNENVVLGLFTWDYSEYAAKNNANTELDIEFATWGIESDENTLQYAVQPTNFGEFPERYYRPSKKVLPSEGNSSHWFEWTDSSVYFASYNTYDLTNTENKIDSWIFTNNNPARAGKGEAIIVPVPTPDTKVHINLWLFDKNKDGIGDAPSDGKEIEIILDKFEFKTNDK